MKDGHVHTNYCPHGSLDSFDSYIQKALDLGLTEISFTEHFPLPTEFLDCYPQFNNGGNMAQENLMLYFSDVSAIKEKYKDQIKINIGIELDYVEGYEKEIASMLNKFGEYIDDSLLSVHILKIKDEYFPIDLDQDIFNRMVEKAGSIQNVYRIYYETIVKSMSSDLGIYKPKRIGHLNLIRLFSHQFITNYSEFPVIVELLDLMKKDGYTIDYNISGKNRPSGIYIDDLLFRKILEHGIEMIYGSDSHNSDNLETLKEFFNPVIV